MVITPKKNAKEDDPLRDRYLVFATNFGIHEARSRLADIPKIYKALGHRDRIQGCKTDPSIYLQQKPLCAACAVLFHNDIVQFVDVIGMDRQRLPQCQ